MKQLLFLLGMLCLVSLSGCVLGPVPHPVGTQPLARVAAIDETGLFAATPDGRQVALASDGVQLIDLASGFGQQLSTEQPLALAWAADGLTLAAAFAAAEFETRLVIYNAQGKPLLDTVLPVALSQLTWSARGDLLVTGITLKIYSFGGDLMQKLYRLDGEDFVETLLSNTTLKPATVKRFSSMLLNLHPVAFSPFGDELAYLHLHDPPQFQPYLQLLYQNWQVGSSRPLREMPLQQLQLEWDPSAQVVFARFSNGQSKHELWPISQDVVSSPAVERYRFVAGRLYDNGELLADWGEGARLQLLSAGRFLLATRRGLYLGDGLQLDLPKKDNERAWTLRRWRYQGLISADEYHTLLPKENP